MSLSKPIKFFLTLGSCALIASSSLARADEETESYKHALHDLRKIRATYLRSNNPQRRQDGLFMLTKYDDAPEVQALIETLQNEREDVRQGLHDHLASLQSDVGDAGLSWLAIYSDSQKEGNTARARLIERLSTREVIPINVQRVLAAGLRGTETQATAAADIADQTNLIRAIPAMISAQIAPTPRERTGPLGTIVIGTQQAFVSDLTPVVANGAVGFDPTISVITSGVVLQPNDAYVVTYRSYVNASLINLTSRAWGKSTMYLGYDQNAWNTWYKDHFIPDIIERANATNTHPTKK